MKVEDICLVEARIGVQDYCCNIVAERCVYK